MFVFNKNMRVRNISYQTQSINNNKKLKQCKDKAITIPSFCGYNKFLSIFIKQEENLPPDYDSRMDYLRENDIDGFDAECIAGLPQNQYKRALELMKQNVFKQSIPHVAQLDDDKYKQAQTLIKMGIIDQNLSGLANNNEAIFERITDLRKRGMHIDYLMLYCSLNDKQYKQALKLVEQGYHQNIAAYLVQLSKEQKEIFLKLINKDTYAPLAFEIAKQRKNTRERTLNFIKQGMDVYDAIENAELSKSERKRAEELFPLNIGDSNIPRIAKLRGKDKTRAEELLSMGVFPEYIADLVYLENGITENDDYKKYLEKGYSPSTAYSLSLLDKEEIEQLVAILKVHPKMEDLFRDNYDINIIENQITEDYAAEAILSKEMRTADGTLITIVKTFSEDGTVTSSRTEEYKDNSTSSYIRDGNRLLRINYNRFGQIDEVLHLLEDEKTHSVEGAIYSKASEILPGVYDSVYYDISEFRQDTSDTEEAMKFNISEMITGKGMQISKAIRNPDGSITFSERYEINGILSERRYEEKKDESGNIIDSSYSYTITDDDGTILMDINRRMEKNKDGSITNIINGVEYKLYFDDRTRTVIINDGKNTKFLNFSTILPYYSKEEIWEIIKSQPVDTLLTIGTNIDKWSYCNENDSQIYSHINEICTGKDLSVISHETGHIIQKVKSDSLYDDDFLETYDQEMMNFLTSFSYNEQEYIQYFSPRADLSGSLGYEEFISEANLLLTTYGSPVPSLTTRSQILARYFPKTIVKIAEAIGKTSKKSLLEEHV